eukprot:5421299-Amphidinium_carterae.3
MPNAQRRENGVLQHTPKHTAFSPRLNEHGSIAKKLSDTDGLKHFYITAHRVDTDFLEVCGCEASMRVENRRLGGSRVGCDSFETAAKLSGSC